MNNLLKLAGAAIIGAFAYGVIRGFREEIKFRKWVDSLDPHKEESVDLFPEDFTEGGEK